MEKPQPNKQNETEERLPDLSVSTQQAEEAKGGSITLNFTQFHVDNTGMDTEHKTTV